MKSLWAVRTFASQGLTVLHEASAEGRVVSRFGGWGHGSKKVEVVDLMTLKPLDKETILKSVRKTSKLLIVHEDNLTGGVGAEIAAIAANEAFESLDAPIERLCGPDVPTMPFASTLEEAYMPTSEKIVDVLRKLVAF